MRTLRRLKFMSSPSLSDLGKREPAAAAADERGTQQRRACANATWNSIHNGVIAVFQRKGLPDQELFSLNEGVRTEAAGLAGRDLGFLLQRRAAHAAGRLLPGAGQGAVGAPAGSAALPEHHHPQCEAGGRAGPGPRPRAPRRRADAVGAAAVPDISEGPFCRLLRPKPCGGHGTLQFASLSHCHSPRMSTVNHPMLQGVHESRGVTKDYLRLETLIQKVVSPYLGTYGLYSSEGAFTHSCILEKHFLRRSRSGDILAKNPVVRSKSYNTPLLNPVAEHEAEGAVAGGTGIRRHSVSEMTSCPEPQGFADTPGQDPAGTFRPSPAPPSGPCPSRLYPPAQPPEPGPGPARSSPASSSPENLVDQILESVDSDSEGIFIDFGRGGGCGTSESEGAGGRQSVV
ncbi:proline-rich protein 5 isoform X2 [Sagmatias obliquidens]|uniref:proline-rich protein 5 isoform X2 n=1 Tax=Sagmatias obliquidens TaxID=3371155 RepID=UPI000F44127A|nr:proline-rich protein 5 isoform X2 [Lagenorhynchus obliquidens]